MTGGATAGFPTRALAWFDVQRVRVRRLPTDNGSCYRRRAVGAVIRVHARRHRCTRPCCPLTNGMAERFIRALLHE